ncbi:MAG: DMT family transporter [Betaproteobacteria bacterium]|jgi:drug/metabolite transporter (DMT)-like permease|nr:DMT family transporter [Betaproteobacteria bacterium]
MPGASVFSTHPALRGVALMIAAVGVFALLDATGKYLAQSYPVPGIVWARYAVNLGLLVGWFVARGLLRRMRTARLGVQSLRGLMLGSATLLYMTALSQMPMADAAAIGFVMPLIAAVLAVPMLNERLDGPRLLAVLAGLGGAVVIVRPGFSVFTPYALLPIGMAVCNALYQILTRKLAGVEHPMTSLFWGALIGTLLYTPFLPASGEMPREALDWVLFGLMGVFGLVGHLLLIRAYDFASASLLVPMHYSQLVWVILLGYLVFDDFPDGWSLVGMAIIVVSGLYLVNRQRLAVSRS